MSLDPLIDSRVVSNPTSGNSVYKDLNDHAAQLADITTKTNGWVNVKSFGAKGDGVTDDTVAIQNAINAISEEYVSGIGGWTYTATALKLYFPKGTYRITNTLNVQKNHEIDFGKAILKFDTVQDIFMFNMKSYNAVYTGGAFTGAKIFTLTNSNSDQGLIRFSNMEFKGCNIAINADVQSSKCIIEKCKFDDVIHPLVQIKCDDMNFIKNWSESSRPPENASGNIIVQGGRLTLKDNILIPLTANPTTTESAWVDFSGAWLLAENNRFSGEEGNRCPINWKRAGKFDATFDLCGLTLKDNLIAFNSSTETSSAVRLFQFPNHMYIKNNYYAMLTNYVVSFTTSQLTSLNTSLTDLQNRFFNYVDITSPFYGVKYSRYSYSIEENNFYLNQHDGTDYQKVERQNEWYFLLNNYKNFLKYVSNPQVYTLATGNPDAQIITGLQPAYTTGNRVVKLPLAGITDSYSTPLKLSVAWNDNFNGSNYHHVQEILMFYIKTYENSAVVSKVGYKNLVDSTFDGASGGINVLLGLYDTSGTTYFDGTIPANVQGICMSFPGSYVTPYTIRVYK